MENQRSGHTITAIALLCVIFIHSSNGDLNLMTAIFRRMDSDMIISLNSLYSVQLNSVGECAILCLNHPSCQAVVVEPQSQIECSLKSNDSIPYMEIKDPFIGYLLITRDGNSPISPVSSAVQRVITSSAIASSSAASTTEMSTAPIFWTLPPQTVTSQALTSAGTVVANVIVDIVERIFYNKCNPSSQDDFAVITVQGVYFYYDDNLGNPPCHYVADVKSVFHGYSDLPDVTTWAAVMAYQNSFVDVYVGSKVYRWQNGGSDITKVTGYPKWKGQHINDITFNSANITPFQIIWAVNRRDKGGPMIYFYEATSYYFIFNNQQPTEKKFLKTATDVLDQNGNDLNVWLHLPDNVVAMATNDNAGGNFVCVTFESQQYFYYTVDNAGAVTLQGNVRFS